MVRKRKRNSWKKKLLTTSFNFIKISTCGNRKNGELKKKETTEKKKDQNDWKKEGSS